MQALARELFSAFPNYKPYGGRYAGFVPHLTLAQRPALDLDRIEQEISADLQPHLPLRVKVREVAVLDEQADGTWQVRLRMSLDA